MTGRKHTAYGDAMPTNKEPVVDVGSMTPAEVRQHLDELRDRQESILAKDQPSDTEGRKTYIVDLGADTTQEQVGKFVEDLKVEIEKSAAKPLSE